MKCKVIKTDIQGMVASGLNSLVVSIEPNTDINNVEFPVQYNKSSKTIYCTLNNVRVQKRSDGTVYTDKMPLISYPSHRYDFKTGNEVGYIEFENTDSDPITSFWFKDINGSNFNARDITYSPYVEYVSFPPELVNQINTKDLSNMLNCKNLQMGKAVFGKFSDLGKLTNLTQISFPKTINHKCEGTIEDFLDALHANGKVTGNITIETNFAYFENSNHYRIIQVTFNNNGWIVN